MEVEVEVELTKVNITQKLTLTENLLSAGHSSYTTLLNSHSSAGEALLVFLLYGREIEVKYR